MIDLQNSIEINEPKLFLHRHLETEMNLTNFTKNNSKTYSKIDKTQILMTNDSLMKVKSIAECSPWNILQYF